MWTPEHRRAANHSGLRYPSDLTDAEWAIVASANYIINEWFDRDFDKFHPTKSQRSAVQRYLRRNIVLFEWVAFLGVGLACAFAASKAMFLIASVFALQGIVYNVPPLRTKDKPYLDVIFESINNPLRLMIGWAMVDPTTFPPSSVILSYWAGGGFLMAAKRLSEFRETVASVEITGRGASDSACRSSRRKWHSRCAV